MSGRVCEYMNERKLFDAIYFVPLKRMGATANSDYNHLAEIFGRCMEEEFRGRDDVEGIRVRNMEDLLKATMLPSRPRKSSRQSMNGVRNGRKSARILFVVDNCDSFVPESYSSDEVPDAVAEAAPIPKTSHQQHTPIAATAVQSQSLPRPMGLITLLDNLFRRTENVKCLLTASTRILGDNDVLLINEPEKLITLRSLSDKQSAELMVKLAPRGLKPSEMNSNNPMTALDTLAARPVLKDLGGHPRAIAIFSSGLADKLLDDSEPMRRFAKDALQRAKAWTEAPHPSAFVSPSPIPTGRSVDKQGHFPIPIAVAVSTNTSPIISSGLPLALPHRVARSTSESTKCFSRPHVVHSSNSSGALFSMAPSSKSGNNTPRVHDHQPPPIHQAFTSQTSRLADSGDQTQDSTPQKFNVKSIDPVVLEEAYRVSRTVISDRICADVWAKVTAAAAVGGGGRNINGGQSASVLPTSVRWSSLISALSESLETETRVSREVEADVSETDMDISDIRTITLSRRLTKDDAKFVFHRMQLDQSSVVNSNRGHVDYTVERSRYMIFCKWWAPLLQSLSILNAEFSCKNPIIIHGFLNRQKTEEKLLSVDKVGVFLLRFSESQAGYLVVSFTDMEKGAPMKVHHCLVNVGTDGVSIYFERGECKYSSLQELVMNCSNLLILYPNTSKEIAFDEILPFALSK